MTASTSANATGETPRVTVECLTACAEEARQQVAPDGDVCDQCLPICNVLDGLLRRAGLPDSVDIGPFRVFVCEHRHQVLFVPCTYVEEYADQKGSLLVDASFDQFSAENEAAGRVEVSFGPAADLPTVRLLPPRADARLFIYHDSPLRPTDDVFEYL